MIILRHKEGNVQWAVWETCEPLDVLLTMLPPARRLECESEIKKFSSLHRQVEYISTRVLLYLLLGFDRIEGCSPDGKPFDKDFSEGKQILYTPEGKPYIADGSYHIGISHTRGYVAVILSPASPVGIDIEKHGNRILRVASRFLHPDEEPEPYKCSIIWSLLLHWSAKETVYKCADHPDPDLRHYRLSHFFPQPAGNVQVSVGNSLFAVDYLIQSDFVLTWTSLHNT